MYSPDGSRVAYVVKGEVVAAAADGSHPEEGFATLWMGAPFWSPTGERIAFTSQKAHQLNVLDAGTGTVTSLSERDESAGFWIIEFSPEGDRILYSRWTKDGRTSLWSINADGSQRPRLVAGTGWGDRSSPTQTP